MTSAATLLDIHVHFYRCFRLADVVKAAWDNIERARGTSEWDALVGCFVSTEIGPGDPTEFVRRGARGLPPRWTAAAADHGALVLRHDGAPAIAIVPGRQVVTREGLEVLAVATQASIEHGAALRETIRSIRNAEGVPVLPWGFGKWSFERGKRLDAYLDERPEDDVVFLGDSGCRPQAFGIPKRLAQASARGLRVLAGSDPLPFRDHEGRAGSYATLLRGEIDWGRPSGWLRSKLAGLKDSPEIIGEGRPVYQFFHDQIRARRRRVAAA